MAKAKRVRPKPPVEMDEKSANPGDRMKHALSLEVLSRTGGWPKVTYSETHAGAGVYLETKQKSPKTHIRNLREQVLWELLRSTLGAAPAGTAAPSQPLAGTAYLHLLREWWLQSDRFDTYPGSAVQAGEYLNRGGRAFDLLLTEADETTCKRLQKAVKNFSGQARYKSFEDELDWLTKPDHLYLVVDPFRCVDSFTGHPEPAEGSFGVAKGDIDHGIVRDILERCSAKSSAVIQFWWPTTSQDGKNGITAIVTDSNRRTRQLFAEWEAGAGVRCYRQFDDNHNHASALLGVGQGAEIVREIGLLEWNHSWLSSCVRHRRHASPEEVA